MGKRIVEIGERVEVEMPYSEVCMWLRIAGKRMPVEIIQHYGPCYSHLVQVYGAAGTKFSTPITTGEAGIRFDHLSGDYYIEITECLNGPEGCRGAVEYRMALSATGRSFPRCDGHWSARLDIEERTRARYPQHPPADWSPLDAGESWYEEV